MSDKNEYPHLIRAQDAKSAEGQFSHPWNPKSCMIGTHLSKAAGLQRTGVSIVRIPAGHESFTYHAHHREEEWIYVLSGRGIADIEDEEYEVAAGDFIGFPTSVAHHMRNPFDEDLVYLMGGENLDTEIADFPRLGKRMVRMGDDVAVYNLDDGKAFGLQG